ncbi:MAG TPA: hypothetical protein VN851_19920 [Thermoanaerobaculia bacterium]|nr:hypothetical protein [Thermoanaerobaculia bacterium]
MDAETDGVYSRAPELEDLVDLCRALNREGARYLLIGGFAVILHGFIRSTKDIDFLVEASAENVQAIKRAMASLPDNAAALIADDEVERYGVVRVADEIVVDLMAKACGISYPASLVDEGVVTFRIQDVEIPVASKTLLIRLKDTIRPSDAADVEFLRFRLEEERRAKG